MAHRANGKPLTVEERQTLEAGHTFRRIVELRLDPARGKFDAAHLKEINRRIFQDLPGLGFGDVTPGLYRLPAPVGKDWIKSRALETVDASSNVAYSPMGKEAQARGGQTQGGFRQKRHSGESRNPRLHGYGRQSRAWNERLRKAGREAGRIARLILAGTTRVLSFPPGGNGMK